MSNDNPIPPSVMSELEQQNAWEEAPEHEHVINESPEVKEETPAPEPESPPEEEKEVPWEKRYKDMESEFGRRGTKVNDLEKELDRGRLERLELTQKLQELESAKSELNAFKEKEEEKPDPFESESYYSDVDKQAMEDFPELSNLTEKMIRRELNKAAKDSGGDSVEYLKRIKELEERLAEQEKISRIDNFSRIMRDKVSEKWQDIDNDDNFHTYVNSSRTRYKMMTEGDMEDRVDVMKSFMATPEGSVYGEQIKEEIKEEEDKDERRQAAQGLISKGGSSADRNPREMSIDELWEETPEYTE